MENLLLLTIHWIFSHIHFADILLAIFFFIAYSYIYQKLTSKGPILWPIVGMVPSFIIHANDLHDWNTRALIRSGGTYYFKGLLLGNVHGVVTSDPAKVEYMLKTRFYNFPKGSYYRERFSDLLGDGIFNADGDNWKEQRRIATSEMHTSRFLDYSAKVIEGLLHKKLLKLIEENTTIAGGHLVDLQEWLLRFTFDNVCIAAFGVDPGCLALDLPEIPFANAFEDATEYSILRFLTPPFVWKVMRYFDVGRERKLKEAVHIVHEFADNTVKNRKAYLAEVVYNENTKHDLLSRLIRSEKDVPCLQQGSNNLFSDKFLRDFCTSLILAGRDTSSVALTWFFWLIHEKPDVDKKIRNEIGQIVNEKIKRGESESKYNIVFQAEELERMVYLHATLTEAMRLYPPVPVDFKQVIEDDVYPDGMVARKGGRVYYHIYAMGRMESIWGKDCNEFKPERWIKEGQFVNENPFKYVIFNAGPRLCAGKKFAYLQMKMIAASILWRYKVIVAEGQVISPKVTTTLYMKNGLLVTFEPRHILT
ncbi:hypothetical protein Droror1_Dr00003470 [Drosera rotundifolia]